MKSQIIKNKSYNNLKKVKIDLKMIRKILDIKYFNNFKFKKKPIKMCSSDNKLILLLI